MVGQQVDAASNTSSAVLERVNPDGKLDPTFGTGGTVTDAATGDEAFYNVSVQADGKIVAAGAAGGQFLLARYNSDGTPDPTFGTGGRVAAPLGGIAAALGIGVDPRTGNIFAAGTSNGQAALARFTPGGVMDTTYAGGTGFALFPIPTAAGSGSPAALRPAADVGLAGPLFSSVVVNSDGSVTVAGAGGTSVVVARVTPSAPWTPRSAPAAPRPASSSCPDSPPATSAPAWRTRPRGWPCRRSAARRRSW